MTARAVAVSAGPSPTVAWSRRVRRVGGIIQLAFAALWLVRGSLAIEGGMGLALAAVFGCVAIAVAAYGLRVTAGIAPRPMGSEAIRIERAITVATILQLIASFAAPALVIALGQDTWVLPSIAITIGPLLLWLDHRLDVRRYRWVGWTLILAPIVLAMMVPGSAVTAVTGIGAGLLLLATAAAGFHDLAVLRRIAV